MRGGALGIGLELALDRRARADGFDAPGAGREHAEPGRAERRARFRPLREIDRQARHVGDHLRPEFRRAPPPTKSGRTGLAPAASSTSTPSANEKATPSMTAKTSASAPWSARRPANRPVASASLCGVRSPLR